MSRVVGKPFNIIFNLALNRLVVTTRAKSLWLTQDLYDEKVKDGGNKPKVKC